MLRILQKEERKTVGRRAPAGKYGNIPSFPCGKSFDLVEKGYSVWHTPMFAQTRQCHLKISLKKHERILGCKNDVRAYISTKMLVKHSHFRGVRCSWCRNLRLWVRVCMLLLKRGAHTFFEENIQIFSDIDALAVSMSEKLLRVCRRHTRLSLEKRVLSYVRTSILLSDGNFRYYWCSRLCIIVQGEWRAWAGVERS